MIEVLRDILDNLDELIVVVVAASSGGFIGGWMALRAAQSSIERTTRASKGERRQAAIGRRRLMLATLEAELRLNAALVRSERDGTAPVAPSWRIPFRDAYGRRCPTWPACRHPADLARSRGPSSHYTVEAERHNARIGTGSDQAAAAFLHASHDRLTALAPNVSDRYVRAADELGGYLTASGAGSLAAGAS